MLETILETLERVDLEKRPQACSLADVVEMQAIIGYVKAGIETFLESHEVHEYQACVYCGSEVYNPSTGCCGEVHNETVRDYLGSVE